MDGRGIYERLKKSRKENWSQNGKRKRRKERNQNRREMNRADKITER